MQVSLYLQFHIHRFNLPWIVQYYMCLLKKSGPAQFKLLLFKVKLYSLSVVYISIDRQVSKQLNRQINIGRRNIRRKKDKFDLFNSSYHQGEWIALLSLVLGICYFVKDIRKTWKQICDVLIEIISLLKIRKIFDISDKFRQQVQWKEHQLESQKT